MPKKEDTIRKMADELIQGGQMTELTCPECETILFRLKNKELFCFSCNKKVVIEKKEVSTSKPKPSSDEPPSKVASDEALIKLRDTILSKIQEFTNRLESITDPEEMTAVLKVINKLLGTIDIIRQIE